MDQQVQESGRLKLAIYWEQIKEIDSLSHQGFYSPGWFKGFGQAGVTVLRTTPDQFFKKEFSPNTADWHLYLPGTPKFFEGGDFQIFNPPREGKRAILLEEDLHFKLHHLLIFTQIYDLVILHDWMSYQAVRASGAQNVMWVPSAYDPEIFFPMEEERGLTLIFLGDQGQYYHKQWLCRADYIHWLYAQYTDKKFCAGTGFYGPQANEWYAKSKIALDLPTYENLGPRVPQVMGAGRMLLMNRIRAFNPAHTHGLVDGVDYASFDGTLEDLKAKIDHYDTHAEEREKIAAAGHEKAVRFTYGVVAAKIVERLMQ